jgi:hypoxanthine phosphoribosyltransferase
MSLAGSYSPLESIVFRREVIAARVGELAASIVVDAARAGVGELTVVAVADGALMFAADLLRELPLPVRFSSLRVSAYGDGMTPRDRAEILGTPQGIAGAHVLIVEDILDTGLTLNALSAALREHNPASLRTAVLLDKPAGRKLPYHAEYVGFKCPDAFVVGYGLDFAGRYRNLPDIGVLRRELRPALGGDVEIQKVK